jgi:DNA topoisomerase-1
MTTIMICEKPDAAKKIAYAIADGKVKHIKSANDVVYFEFHKNNEEHFAVPAVGHIFGLKDVSGKGWTYPIFDLEWAPAYEINKHSLFSKKYFDTIAEVAKKGDKFIIATDLDEEGSVIGYNILKFICKKEDGMRMEFSTLTKQDLVEAYKKLSKHLDFPRIESGLTRHFLDYLWGINVSRALTLSIKHAGKKLSYHVLSAGRVQTPMLYFLIKREKEIQKFKPDPFWELEAHISTEPVTIAYHEDDKFWEKGKVDIIFDKCKGKDATVKDVRKKNVEKAPPFPFDLTSLQTEAYRFFGFSPKRTVGIAQNLYTAGYISYPRTSSQKLPPQIGYKEILQQLSKIKPYEKLCNKLLALAQLKPNEGSKEDAAHPAVYPTAEIPDLKSLKPEERKLYDLITRRFMATFAEPAIRESINIEFYIAGEVFRTTGSRTIEKKWMVFYGPYAKLEEVEFPELKPGESHKVKKLDLLSKETQPPSRYSQGSIVKELEKHNLGTKTTRATILQTLYDRGYIEGKSILVTTLGMKVGDTLAKYTPELVSEELTRDFENSMKKVEEGKAKKETIISKAEKVIENVSKEFKSNETELGLALEKAVLDMKNKKQELGPCPKCDGGKLKVLFSPFTKKRFVGCSSYSRCIKCGFTKTACKCKCSICGGEKGKCKCSWKEKIWTPSCSTGFPLPLKGLIEPTEKICEQCKSPIIKVIRKGARPFTMCLDPKCKTKEGWFKKDKENSNAKSSEPAKKEKKKKEPKA